jgi:hypothetical protein
MGLILLSDISFYLLTPDLLLVGVEQVKETIGNLNQLITLEA